MWFPGADSAKRIWAIVSPHVLATPTRATIACKGTKRGIQFWYEVLSVSHGPKGFWTSKHAYVARAVLSNETSFLRLAENGLELISKLPPYEQRWNGCGKWKRLWAEVAEEMVELSGGAYLNDQTITVQVDISQIYDELKHLLEAKPSASL